MDSAEIKGCSNANCHGAEGGQSGFALIARPEAGSPEELANFNAVVKRTDLQTPNASKIYKRATTRHADGKSALATPEQATALLTWIQEAKASSGGGGGDPGGPAPEGDAGPPPSGGNANCVSPDKFSLGAFKSDVLPILLGQIDYNRPGQPGTGAGCARSACHGVDRPGGAFALKAAATPEENLKSFACFVNLASPIQSNIVQCPLNRSSCKKYPHPGQDVFSGPDDLNYQRVLSFLYAAKTAATPLDFAFFARQIAPIFADVTLGGAPGRTCADTNSCHGVSSVTQAPPNSSDFPIIAGATDKTRLGFNFSAAANFANFLQPTGSSLFLYPTNEIADTSNPFATGLPHPGGVNFGVNSAPARAILTWVQGLRPDGNGYQPNFLVAGDYAISRITDQTGIGSEPKVNPSIFDTDGASQFNDGKWDALLSGSNFVDLNSSFPRQTATNRAAYAVAYILNTTSNDLQARITVASRNALMMWSGEQVVLQSDDARSGATGVTTFSSITASKKTTRLLLKVFQRAGDSNFGFTFQLTDLNGTPFTNSGGELIIKLSPDGGI